MTCFPSSFRDHLRWAVKVLSIERGSQLSVFCENPDEVCYELYEALQDGIHAASQDTSYSVTPYEESLLAEINSVFSKHLSVINVSEVSKVFDYHDDEFWNSHSLDDHPDWNTIRTNAVLLVNAMKIEDFDVNEFLIRQSL